MITELGRSKVDRKCFLPEDRACPNNGCHNCELYPRLDTSFSLLNYCHLLYWVFQGMDEYRDKFPRKRFLHWNVRQRLTTTKKAVVVDRLTKSEAKKLQWATGVYAHMRRRRVNDI